MNPSQDDPDLVRDWKQKILFEHGKNKVKNTTLVTFTKFKKLRIIKSLKVAYIYIYFIYFNFPPSFSYPTVLDVLTARAELGHSCHHFVTTAGPKSVPKQ